MLPNSKQNSARKRIKRAKKSAACVIYPNAIARLGRAAGKPTFLSPVSIPQKFIEERKKKRPANTQNTSNSFQMLRFALQRGSICLPSPPTIPPSRYLKVLSSLVVPNPDSFVKVSVCYRNWGMSKEDLCQEERDVWPPQFRPDMEVGIEVKTGWSARNQSFSHPKGEWVWQPMLQGGLGTRTGLGQSPVSVQDRHLLHVPHLQL